MSAADVSSPMVAKRRAIVKAMGQANSGERERFMGRVS